MDTKSILYPKELYKMFVKFSSSSLFKNCTFSYLFFKILCFFISFHFYLILIYMGGGGSGK